MTPPGRVLIVGASAAGLSTAEALRRHGYRGHLTLLDAEPHLPYDRPPLSKQVLAGAWEPARAGLRSQAQLEALDAEFVRGEPAVALDAAARAVTTATGRVLRADAVVVATGLTARRLPGQDGLAGVHTLRGLDDALALRAGLSDGTRLVVVGEGVLGAEIAATVRTMGRQVTLAGLGAALLSDQLGDVVGAMLTRTHAERGVRLRLGVAVDALTGAGGRVTGVRLATGELLPADVVVVAVGSRPATGWLRDSGLSLGDGVECDSRCRAAEGVYAVGDVASFAHEGLGRRLRLENRTNATEQAQAVAANILGADRPYTPIPYFWTDQYDVKIQAHGLPSPSAEVTIAEGDPEQHRFAALYRENGRVTGVLGWNMPKQARLLRQQALTT
ncbi:NADPH-dependent 2,4-dienoyl-CoA reductase/sulfur reductase-like enzyme [Streptosporangium becharense]|uniref:NADPH-dependent 2,4-dienoyl-CoA reductase/sulfur reductase-like enzyme n=1 Tax=Streptosporangium becharense TaxID=1816182 RepID=A0A7W9ME81_9ACTN|nr:FAD-dependent oxidoreductase [Streptosporangium becharense]MBB2914169.1 NADPH-dependent 2,4-dienoyl-CoA reductase/sulfur reductase-like enzyme [Streptosporangium becharense]MBB5817196.1 NADPH-dependent 2,4-dienoyl-CoA reductase/sulfur reductase-like enzyme [Streptosporangium becharense]